MEVRTVDFDGERLLLEGEIDALDAVGYAIPRTEGKGYRVHFIPYTASGVPDSPFLVFTGSFPWVKEHGNALKKFFKCLKEGFSLVQRWNEKEWGSYTSTCKGRTPQEEMNIWKSTLPLIDDGGRLLEQNIPEIEKLQDILYQKGLLWEKYPIADVFVNSYIH